MKLDRNTKGRGKYSLVHNRKLDALDPEQHLAAEQAISLLKDLGVYDEGDTVESEFFVLKLKDAFANSALFRYAEAARVFDREYCEEIKALARRAGPTHPDCKRPD